MNKFYVNFIFIALFGVLVFNILPASAQEASIGRPIDPENDNPFTIAGEVLGAPCDANEAYNFLLSVPGGKKAKLKPQIGVSAGIHPGFACRLAEYIKVVRSLGCNPTFTSGYRSYVKQKSLYEAYKSGRGGTAAPPGASCHEYGAAVDLIGASKGKGCAMADGKLAAKYGLIFGYAGLKNKNVPSDNRRKGRNHFQCIENPVSGASGGCSKNACGSDTPPAYNPSKWSLDTYSDDEGPDTAPEIYGIDENFAPPSMGSGNNFPPVNVPTGPYPNYNPYYDTKYPQDEDAYTDYNDFYDYDDLLRETDDENNYYDNENDDKTENDNYHSNTNTGNTKGTKGNTSTSNNGRADSSYSSFQRKENRKRKLLYKLFTTPFNRSTAKLYKDALFGSEEEKEFAFKKLNELEEKQDSKKQKNYEVREDYTYDLNNDSVRINYTPWYLKYKNRENQEAVHTTERLANFFYGDLPPQERLSWWQIVLQMFGFR